MLQLCSLIGAYHTPVMGVKVAEPQCENTSHDITWPHEGLNCFSLCAWDFVFGWMKWIQSAYLTGDWLNVLEFGFPSKNSDAGNKKPSAPEVNNILCGLCGLTVYLNGWGILTQSKSHYYLLLTATQRRSTPSSGYKSLHMLSTVWLSIRLTNWLRPDYCRESLMTILMSKTLQRETQRPGVSEIRESHF